MSVLFRGGVEVLKQLCEKFPKAFFLYEARRVPLKVGIRQNIEAALGDAVEPKLLYFALKHYFVNVPYLKSQRAGVERVDLDGMPAGVVSEQDELHAKKAIAGLLKVKKKPKPKPKPAPVPKRDGLSALKEAARKRRAAVASTGGRA